MNKLIQIEKNQTYSIYCGHSHKSLACGLSPIEASMINELIGSDGFYCVINKRNGEFMPELLDDNRWGVARCMSKEKAVNFARGWEGTIAVKDNVYLAQADKAKATAISIKDGIHTVIDGRLSKYYKELFKENNVVGNDQIKRELGSYTDSWQEKLYVAGYMYSKTWSPIINKPTHKPKPIERDYAKDWMNEGLRFIRKNPTANASKIMRAIVWPKSVVGQQRFTFVKKIRNQARILNLC